MTADAISSIRRSVNRAIDIIVSNEHRNDHDTLRYDPIFQLDYGWGPDDQAQTVTQPTLLRFENVVEIPSLNRL